MRLSDPHAELPIKNFKYVKNCTELYLAKRHIERLANFESFVNLESLWINDNEIETLNGLDTCIRIKCLYAQSNRIRTLIGSSLSRFTFLRELRLYDNKLQDLQSTLTVLSTLRHLQDLDLFDNPLQEEASYRLQVIGAVPTLLVLDRHVITDDERAKAKRFRSIIHGSQGASSSYSSSNGTDKKPQKQRAAGAGALPQQQMSGTVRLLFAEVAAIQREQQAKERADTARELRELSDTHKSLLASTSTAKSHAKRTSVIENLDDWDLAALRKRFHAKEATKNSGVVRSDVADLLAFLTSRGYKLSVNGQPLVVPTTTATTQSTSASTLERTSESVAAAIIQRLFSLSDATTTSNNVSWADLLQCLESRRLQCDAMTVRELHERAAWCFATSAALQSRLDTLTTASDTKRQEALVAESLELAQQAYHLQALADKLQEQQDAAAAALSVMRVDLQQHHKSTDATSHAQRSAAASAVPATKYMVTTYARASIASAPASLASSRSSPSNTFHTLGEQKQTQQRKPTDAAALSTKYRLHDKDYAAYELRRHGGSSSTGSAPSTKQQLVKRSVQL